MDELYLSGGGNRADIAARDNRAPENIWKNFEDAGTALGALGNAGVLGRINRVRKNKICGCFIAGTKVKLETGEKNIEEVRVGDLVWAYDDSTNTKSLKQVISIQNRNWNQIYTVFIADEKIETTSEHPFKTNRGWIQAKDLAIGDSLFVLENKYIYIDSIVISDKSTIVYNFTVDDYHTYFVGKYGFLVHNTGPCPYKLSSRKVQTEVDAMGKDLSTKTLMEVEADLLAAGWIKVGKEKAVTTYKLGVPVGNGYDKAYILKHNANGVKHSSDNKPTQYWKLYEDRMKSNKVLFRGSNSDNFVPGGSGKTFIKGKEVNTND